MLEPGRVYLGDCLEVMGEIADGSVDMILCDLPYGTTACAWDSRIPLEPLWAHYKRVIKPNGAIVLTASQPFTSVLVMSNLAWFKYEWVWQKTNAGDFMSSSSRPRKMHENICVFYDSQPTYNPQFQKGKPYIDKPRRRTNRIADSAMPNLGIANHGFRFPSSIQKVSNGNNGIVHPTQKPVALFAYLIRTYTNPGELVLDNCIGSGTTAIAAIETGRRWIGIEKDAEYHRLATERIEQRLKQPFLPGLVEPVRVNGKQLAMEGV